MFAVSIPNSATFVGVRRHRDEVPRDRRLVAAEPRRAATLAADVAFVIVSSVVNVFDETMNSVSAGSRSAQRLERDRRRRRSTRTGTAARGRCRRAARRTPSPARGRCRRCRCSRRCGCGDRCARATCRRAPASANAPIRSQHRVHLGDDVDTVDDERRVARGIRSATCSTGRSSVTLTCSPREHRVDPLAPARARRRARASSRMRLVGDPVLGVVEVPARGFDVQALGRGPGRRRTAPAGRDRRARPRASVSVRHSGRSASAGIENSRGSRSKRGMPPHRQ